MASPSIKSCILAPEDASQHLGFPALSPESQGRGESCPRAETGTGRTWICLLLVGLVWVGSAALGGLAATGLNPWGNGVDRDASAVKAALVFKFLRYLEWEPGRFENERSVLVVGVVGNGKMARSLEKALKGKSHDKHSIAFRRFATPEAVRDCHVLFVTASMAGPRELKRVLERLPQSGVFVVGESKDFTRRGGILNFYLEEEKGKSKVRFEVNPDEAKRRKIKVSASLLKLARIVRDPEGRDASREGQGSTLGSKGSFEEKRH